MMFFFPVAGAPYQTVLWQTQQLAPKGIWVDRQGARNKSVLFILLSGLSVYMLKCMSCSSPELEPQLNVALVVHANQIRQYFRNALFFLGLSHL